MGVKLVLELLGLLSLRPGLSIVPGFPLNLVALEVTELQRIQKAMAFSP